MSAVVGRIGGVALAMRHRH